MAKKRSIRFTPCEHCPHRKGCDIKKRLRGQLKGVILKSADFDCQKRLSTLPRGQGVFYGTKSGTVMGPYRQKLLVWRTRPDPPYSVAGIKERSRYVAARWPDELELWGGIVPHCSKCGRPDDAELPPIDVHWCWKCQGYDSEDAWRTELDEMSHMQCYRE
jgi:hypothetical protein